MLPHGNCPKQTSQEWSVVIARDIDPKSRSYPLEQNWLCVKKWERFFLFLLPATEELPVNVEAVVTLPESLGRYIIQQWLDQRYTFVSASKSEFPIEGYIVDSRELQYRRKSEFHEAAMAIRIRSKNLEMSLDDCEPLIDAGIVDLNQLVEFSSTTTRSLSWLSGIWRRVLGLSTDLKPTVTQLVRMSDPTNPFDSKVDLKPLLRDLELKQLVSGHLYAWWESNNVKLEERGRQLQRMGLKIIAHAGTVHNLVTTSGLKNPQARDFSKIAKCLQTEAVKFQSSLAEKGDEAWDISIREAESQAMTFLVPFFPEDFNQAKNPSSIRCGSHEDYYPPQTTPQ